MPASVCWSKHPTRIWEISWRTDWGDPRSPRSRDGVTCLVAVWHNLLLYPLLKERHNWRVVPIIDVNLRIPSSSGVSILLDRWWISLYILGEQRKMLCQRTIIKSKFRNRSTSSCCWRHNLTSSRQLRSSAIFCSFRFALDITVMLFWTRYVCSSIKAAGAERIDQAARPLDIDRTLRVTSGSHP